MTTERLVRINLDTVIGQMIYWLIVELMGKYPDAFEDIKSGEL